MSSGRRLVRPAGVVTDAFFRWLNEREEDGPFFAMVHYFDPHDPLTPPPDVRTWLGACEPPRACRRSPAQYGDPTDGPQHSRFRSVPDPQRLRHRRWSAAG